MTATGYVDSNVEGGTHAAGTTDTRCVIENQRQTEEMMTRVKVTSMDDVQNNDNKDESDPFIDNNHRQIGKLNDELKPENYLRNKLLSKGIKTNDDDNGDKADDNYDNSPPDGGFRAWMIMLGSFTINGIFFGIINSYSLIYVELTEKLGPTGDPSVSWKASLVGSLTIGSTFFLSPIAGMLTDKIGIQMTTFLGGAIAFGGMLLSSMFAYRLEILFLTYGVMYGAGASLAYTPSLAILGHYFKRYLGLVNGIVTAGSAVFTIIMPQIIRLLLVRFGLVVMLRCFAILTSIVMLCAVLFKPIPVKNTGVKRDCSLEKTKFQGKIKPIFNRSIWMRRKYVVWASAIPLALFGYFVPYVHMANFVKVAFPGKATEHPIMCIGITSGIGRLVFGYIADLPRVNRILLQQISFISIGILTMLLPLTPPYYIILLLITLLMGLFDGCFISLLGPIAFDICGREGATQAIGFLLGMCSIPLTVGPPIGGLLYDYTGSYTLPFVLAGIPPIVGALAMFLVQFVKDPVPGCTYSLPDEPINDDACLNGIEKTGCGLYDGTGDLMRQEGRSTMKLQLSTAINWNDNNQQNCTVRACYSEPLMDLNNKFDNFNNQLQSNECDCIEYSESVPLLINSKFLDKKNNSNFMLKSN